MPTAINSSGVVVGDIVGRYDRQAFRWFRGVWQPLGFLGGTDTLGGRISTATAVNTSGKIVGTSTTAAGEFHAFELVGATMKDLGTPGSHSSAAAVNDLGQTVGTHQRPDGSTRAALWWDRRMYDLGTLGGPVSYPVSINNAGQVVGHSLTADGQLRAFLWQRGHMTDLGVLPGDQNSEALAITSHGQVLVRSVGTQNRGFLWINGQRIELGPAASAFDPVDINDNGLVAGTMSAAGGQRAATWYRGALTVHGTLGGPYSSVAKVTAGNALVGSATREDLLPVAAVWPAAPRSRWA
ncbi:HAF repeat-containing protein [Frankia sp. EI5c]|uniref:HAF repeat-containing protein n=1 Tax=Frankia sp. EI5c TaxID=683316 RepID=UPI001F5B1C62|nr:HAF repeat-containing protein [Frankia sp. EI5c]